MTPSVEMLVYAWAPINGLLRWLAAHPEFVVVDSAPGHHGVHSVMVSWSRPKQATTARVAKAPAEHKIRAVG